MLKVAALLEHERRKLSLLQKKVAEQAEFVQVLERIQGKSDPLDAVLESELASTMESTQQPATGTNEVLDVGTGSSEPRALAAEPSAEPATPLASVLQWGQQPRLPRRIPLQWVALYRYIGPEGKTFDELKMFIKDRGLQITEGATRTALMNYRKKNGFIENPRKGFYKATPRALQFIDAQERGGPTLTDGTASDATDPLTRAAA